MGKRIKIRSNENQYAKSFGFGVAGADITGNDNKAQKELLK